MPCTTGTLFKLAMLAAALVVSAQAHATIVTTHFQDGIGGEPFDVFSYPTLADFANDTNGTLIGSTANTRTRDLASSVIPEPAQIPVLSVWGTLLLGSGLVALAAARRRAL